MTDGVRRGFSRCARTPARSIRARRRRINAASAASLPRCTPKWRRLC